MQPLFIAAGDMAFSDARQVVSTVLGSCVAVCIHDTRRRCGGMNHFVLPAPQASTIAAGRRPNEYATFAIPNLLKVFKRLGSSPRDLLIKIAGGAAVLDANGTSVGELNVQAARQLLGSYGLTAQTQDVGGALGRQIEFHTGTGELRRRIFKAAEPEDEALSGAAMRHLILIGASTGGPEAIVELLRSFPATMPPILIVQHMPVDFTAKFADRLATLCKLKVKEADVLETARPGHVYVGRGGLQMRIVQDGAQVQIRQTHDEPVNGFCPSVDVLFDSALAIRNRRKVAILLTGMGDDGARGLLHLKAHGAYTIAQDKASSVVFGMPREAIELGAATHVAPLSGIGRLVLQDLRKAH